MGLTTNLEEARNSGVRPDGQQNMYAVLSDEELKKGFVRPVRYSYKHLGCGAITSMGQKLSETYARNPHFYGGTFCCNCGKHFYLRNFNEEPMFGWTFEWLDGEPVGSDIEEAQEYLKYKRELENNKNIGYGI